MKFNLKKSAEQLLLVLNFFVAFLLLFAHKLVLPYWMQPLGRMHPMLLHFPIALLLLWVVLYWIGKKENLLLLAGSLFSGLTVVAGIFLSKETEYSTEELFWHKWTGALLFFLASITYVLEQTKYRSYKFIILSPFLLLTAVLFTGHFGGNITHGQDFLLSPILSQTKKEIAPFDSAEVYKDLIQPLLNKKCSSCHNAQKMKGELSLADTIALLKGGKSGDLFLPGQIENSLLLQRIHLTVEDEKHMPPIEKPQLSADEINLLGWWVKNHTNFRQRISALPQDDSLVIWVRNHLYNEHTETIAYDFSAVDASTITQLNTSYRTVLKLDRESPAVQARLFSKETYHSKQLEEMNPIREQLVSLNLSKLPVTDEDLKTIAGFENLRQLDLNFTNITTAGLRSLTGLQKLEKLSIAGTALTEKGLLEILKQFRQLKTIIVWDTRLSLTEMNAIEKSLSGIRFVKGFGLEQGEALKLNPPQLKNSSQVFRDSIWVDLRHPIKGASIRFTSNGKEPDSLSAELYNNHTLLTTTTILNTKAFKKGWYSSDALKFGFYKNRFIPDSVRILTPLNAVHQAEGTQTFFNGKLGTLGANNPAWANFWAGVRHNEMSVECFFNKPVSIASFGLRYMVEESTGIYPPTLVEIWGGTNAKQVKLLGKIKPSMPAKEASPSMEYGEATFKPADVMYLKIIAHPHVKKKDKHLLLVDEFFLN